MEQYGIQQFETKTESHLSYDGKTSSIFKIWLKNLFFQIITFGIYRAWAKTRIRKYVYSSFKIAGDRLEYTGTGGELFKGFIKVNLIIFAVMFLTGIVSMMAVDLKSSHAVQDMEIIKNGVLWVLILLLIFVGKFSALRYRLTRTKWRGIRGHMKGTARAYMLFRLGRMLINIFSFGWMVGRSALLDVKYLTERMYLGNQQLSFKMNEKALDKVNLVTLLLAIPTLGFSRYWFRAALLNEKYNNLSAGPVQFSSSFTGKKLLFLNLGNIAIWLLTLGFGTCFVIQRIVKCFYNNVVITGDIESSQILQASGDAGNIGEGIDDALDYDGIDIDMGLL